MSGTLHAGLAAGRWGEMTLVAQLANIGSEVGRATRVVCDFLVGDNDARSTVESLDAYFLPFAVASRVFRG